jgi:predicted acylesterase/phospholipase RssA
MYIYGLQEAYLKVYSELTEAKVDNKLNTFSKTFARDNRFYDGLTSQEKNNVTDPDNDTSIYLVRIATHKRKRGNKKPAPGSGEDRRNRVRQTLNKQRQLGMKKKNFASDMENYLSPENAKKRKREDMKRRMMSAADSHGFDEKYDLYDIILSHLLDEGYAETQEAAEAIMVNMSEEWREEIIESGPSIS